MTPHVDVGAYLLGVLDDAEMTRFEEHLADCDSCGRELDELSGLLPVLEEVRADEAAYARPPGGDAMLERLLGQVAGERRRRGRRRLAAVAAAAILVIGGPAVTLLTTSDGGSPAAAPPTAAPSRHWATNPATGASAAVGVTDRAWGSAVDLRLSGVHGPRHCRLVAVGLDGSRQTVASWSVPLIGYGTVSQPAPFTVHGSTDLRVPNIRRFDIWAADGTLLVSVPG